MPRSGIRSAIRVFATLVASLALLALTALPALADAGTATTDAEALRQAAIDSANSTRAAALASLESTSTTVPGIGVAAPEIFIAVDPIVIQKDIVIDASLNGTPGTVSQTTSNSADVNQETSAQAGAASAPSGIAISGGAVSGNIVVVTQINVAVVGGYVPAGGVTQDASNSASVDQSANAEGGDASAAGENSVAFGGSATALAITRVSQFNTLWFIGTDPDSTATVNQTGANSAGVSGSASAVAGDATAGEDALARTGNAADLSVTGIQQRNSINNR